jgi:hypothetical protein
MLKRYFRRSSWRQQPVTLRATHRSVVSPLAAVPLAVLSEQLRQLGDVGGDAPGLVASELGDPASDCLRTAKKC